VAFKLQVVKELQDAGRMSNVVHKIASMALLRHPQKSFLREIGASLATRI
jgi:hypothetical protein